MLALVHCVQEELSGTVSHCVPDAFGAPFWTIHPYLVWPIWAHLPTTYQRSLRQHRLPVISSLTCFQHLHLSQSFFDKQLPTVGVSQLQTRTPRTCLASSVESCPGSADQSFFSPLIFHRCPRLGGIAIEHSHTHPRARPPKTRTAKLPAV